MKTVCDSCLRRGALIARLAARIADVAVRDDRRRIPALLSLGEMELVEALAGNGRAGIERMLREFRPASEHTRLADAGCEAICVHSASYPPRLSDLHDSPNPLYVRGGVDRLDRLVAEPGVAIVGARQSSAYGLQVAQEMGRGLAAAGVTVISGLALGIDAAAHRGALESRDAGVVAVLGCGPDVIYPKQNERLYRSVGERGVIVSELAPGTRARKWSFPARNRIMAGLARLVVVVEAAPESGSLITVDFAADIGRDLAAVPGLVTARIAAGSNQMLRDGARIVRNAEDVLEELFGVGSQRARMPDPELDAPLRLVLDAIEVRDSLHLAGERAGLSAGGLRAALGRLETLGLVRGDGFGGYERCVRSGRGT